MADASLIIYDENTGLPMVDSINYNLFLRHKGIAYKQGDQSVAQIDLPAISPVVFVRSLQDDGTITPASQDLGGGLFRFTFWGNCEYYIFDRPWDDTGPMNFWSEDGRHIFQGGEIPLTIYDSPDIGKWWKLSGASWNSAWTWGQLPASKYAVNQSYVRLGYWEYRVPTTTTDIYRESFLPHPNGFQLIYRQYEGRIFASVIGANGFDSYQESCRFSLVDVSSFSV